VLTATRQGTGTRSPLSPLSPFSHPLALISPSPSRQSGQASHGAHLSPLLTLSSPGMLTGLFPSPRSLSRSPDRFGCWWGADILTEGCQVEGFLERFWRMHVEVTRVSNARSHLTPKYLARIPFDSAPIWSNRQKILLYQQKTEWRPRKTKANKEECQVAILTKPGKVHTRQPFNACPSYTSCGSRFVVVKP